MDNASQEAISNILRRTLAEAQSHNPAYSLRSLARRLAVSPSALSEILSGKRRISRKLAERLTERLAVDPRQRQAILSLFATPARAGGSAGGESALNPIGYELLDSDRFAVISDWFHFAIMSLMETKNFNEDPTWIARRLGIRAQDATHALERLERLGLTKRTARGKLCLSKTNLTTSDDVMNLSLRKAHRANLNLAERSLDNDPVESRDFCAVTMAIDPAQLPEAKKMTRAFLDRLMVFLETTGKQQEVYKVCLQLFPLSR